MSAMKAAEIDGVQLEVAEIGATAEAARGRAPLVFLHEGLGSVSMWRDWPATLCAATGRAGWAYSRQGYGQSSPVLDVRGAARRDARGARHGRLLPDYLHHEALHVLPQLLARLGIERPVLVGHSDGATIALIHAAHHPVAACVVMAPHLMVEDVALRSIRATRAAYEAGALRQRLARHHAHVDVAFWQWSDIWLSPDFRAFDIRGECRSISAPVLAIQGLDDEYGTLAQLDALAAAAPQTELLKLAGCGHAPHRDQPVAVNSTIARFLRTAP